VDKRYADGVVLTAREAGPVPAGLDLLFVLRPDGALKPVTGLEVPAAAPGDTLLVLGGADEG
jgi:hypothetical protein